MSGKSPYPSQQPGPYPAQQPYPAQPAAGMAYGYPPQMQPYPAQVPSYAPPAYGNPPPYYPAPGQPLYAPTQPMVVVAPSGSFDAGARFGLGSTMNVPPPPPGYAPTAAQLANAYGQPVVMRQDHHISNGGVSFGW